MTIACWWCVWRAVFCGRSCRLIAMNCGRVAARPRFYNVSYPRRRSPPEWLIRTYLNRARPPPTLRLSTHAFFDEIFPNHVPIDPTRSIFLRFRATCACTSLSVSVTDRSVFEPRKMKFVSSLFSGTQFFFLTRTDLISSTNDTFIS